MDYISFFAVAFPYTANTMVFNKYIGYGVAISIVQSYNGELIDIKINDAANSAQLL